MYSLSHGQQTDHEGDKELVVGVIRPDLVDVKHEAIEPDDVNTTHEVVETKVATHDLVDVKHKAIEPDDVAITHEVDETKVVTFDLVDVKNKVVEPTVVDVNHDGVITTDLALDEPDAVNVKHEIVVPEDVAVKHKVVVPEVVAVTNEVVEPDVAVGLKSSSNLPSSSRRQKNVPGGRPRGNAKKKVVVPALSKRRKAGRCSNTKCQFCSKKFKISSLYVPHARKFHAPQVEALW